MSHQANLEKFNEIYNNTYQNVLCYVVCKCANLADVNDIGKMKVCAIGPLQTAITTNFLKRI